MLGEYRYNEALWEGPAKPRIFYYRGYVRNSYGVISHYGSASRLSLKLEKISDRRMAKLRRVRENDT